LFGVAGGVVGTGDIYGILSYAEFVFASWLIKEKFLASLNPAGKNPKS